MQVALVVPLIRDKGHSQEVTVVPSPATRQTARRSDS